MTSMIGGGSGSSFLMAFLFYLFLFLLIDGVSGQDVAISSKTQLREPAVETRIVGGTPAEEGRYPYFASWEGFCGATLVYGDVALSAGHCAENLQDGGRLQVGAVVRGSSTDGSIYVPVKSWTIHPTYNPSTEEYDFAILKLGGWVQKEYAELNTDPDYPPFDVPMDVIGFGRTFDGGPQSSVLLETQVNHVDNAQCRDAYPLFRLNFGVMLCGLGNGTDSCDGDSGGPLLGPNGQQVGIVSFGAICADPESPGVYSRVSAADEWIQDQICILSDNPPLECGLGSRETGLTRRVRVDVTYFSDASSTSWELLDLEGVIIGSSDEGDVIEDSLVSTYFDLEVGEYEFESDSLDDGGGVQIWLLLDDGDELLLEDDDRGTFFVEFETPAPSASAPPSELPSSTPSDMPTTSTSPSEIPSSVPTVSTSPTVLPSSTPSISPTISSPPSTSASPTDPLPTLSSIPSIGPSSSPSVSISPTLLGSSSPSFSAIPSAQPSRAPSSSAAPSFQPSSVPSLSGSPSAGPSSSPSVTALPSSIPSSSPSGSIFPSLVPSNQPTESPGPSSTPSANPSTSIAPTSEGSSTPSFSAIPSSTPSLVPSLQPTSLPTVTESTSPSVLSGSPVPTLSTTTSTSPTTTTSPTTAGISDLTQLPTLSASPSTTSISPTTSSSPTVLQGSTTPTLSSAPSTSTFPTAVPSLSNAPTSSSSPTRIPTAGPSATLSPSTSPTVLSVPGTESPTFLPTPTSGSSTVRVDISLDSNPESISWKIVDASGVDATPFIPPGFYTSPGFYSTEFFLEPGFYIFIMESTEPIGTAQYFISIRVDGIFTFVAGDDADEPRGFYIFPRRSIFFLEF